MPMNYRGISLLSCMHKLYSGLLNMRLSGLCEAYNIIVDEQNGFRKDRSCLDHIYVVSSVIRNRMISKQSTFAAFIDFQKAFDRVDRNLLFYKLHEHVGLYGRFYRAITSIYAFSSACVKLNTIYTDSFEIRSGVKQGDNLSPTLFSLFINDLAAGIKNLNKGVDIGDTNLSILLYADDIVLLAPDERKLQDQLDFIHRWCQKWRMSVNESKTQVIHFRPPRTPRSDFKWSFGDTQLDTVSIYKYLGVHLDEHLNFAVVANTLSSAASKALGRLRYKLRSLKECQYETFHKLYSCCIVPILDYAAAVWGFKTFPKPETVQHRAIRYFLGVHRFAANCMVEGEMGWLTCAGRRKISMLNFWNRLVLLQPVRLLHKVFIWDRLHVNKYNSWSAEVRTVLCEIGQSKLFDDMLPVDIHEATKLMLEYEARKWEVARYSMPKLRYYNLYKSLYSADDYVVSNISKRRRSLLAQFRAGILPLEIELGRYRDVPLEERVCKLCISGQVEDEFHFLCICSYFNDLREHLYSSVAIGYPEIYAIDDFEKFVYLMCNQQLRVAAYLETAVKRRTNFFYH